MQRKGREREDGTVIVGASSPRFQPRKLRLISLQWLVQTPELLQKSSWVWVLGAVRLFSSIFLLNKEIEKESDG
jgi:hypothetical protein